MIAPNDIEKLVLGSVLSHPNGNGKIPQQVVYELDISRFENPAHSHIYQAIKSCVKKQVVPDVPNLSIELGSTLERVGGLEYLHSLPAFLPLVKAYDVSSLGNWIRQLDLLGRARLIHTILNRKVNIPLEDFQRQVLDSPDPDAYLSDLTTEINRFVTGSKTDYQPFSHAVEEVEQRVKAAARGEVTDLIPCGIPNLEKYSIPRPHSFGVIAGISNQGKTQFALYIAVGVAIGLEKRKERGQVAINTLEEQGSDLAMRVACMMSRTDSKDIARGTLSKTQANSILEQCAYIKTLPIVFNDDPTITSSQFVTHAICQHMREPRILGVTDYVELFADKADKEETRVSQATRNVKSVCHETGSCEVMLVQLNDDATKNTYKTGGMFASRNSRTPAHAADWWIEVLNYPELRKAQMKAVVPDGRNGDLAYALIEKGRKYGKGEEPFEWIAEYTLFRDTSLPLGDLYGEIAKEDDF